MTTRNYKYLGYKNYSYIYDIIEVCDCCGEDIHNLLTMTKEEVVNGTSNLGMKSVVVSKTIDDLDNYGKELVEWCVDFLLFYKYNMSFKKENQEQFHKTKYITIWSFIYNFLQINKDSGYDYWLLCFLEQNYIMEHGSGIRCGFFYNDEKNLYYNRILTEERKNTIIEWAENAPDEL
jgi:hypothetical protein